MSRCLPVVAGLLLFVAGCTDPAVERESIEDAFTRDVPEGVAAPLDWGRCKDSELRDIGAQCATLSVPMDYAKPAGERIRLAVSRVRHKPSAGSYRGVMVTNPGGPGEPGLTVPTLVDQLPGKADQRYDWIGFDPRGVGASRPAVHCDPDNELLYRRTYVTKTAKQVAGWREHVQRYAAACGKRSGALLEHMTTADSALDVESIRMSLGVKRIGYYGFSYGTYLGAVYATLFPERLNRLVLDSNVDPRDVWYGSVFSQDIAFEKNAKAWFRWLAKYDKRYRLGKTAAAVERKYYADLAELPTNPKPGKLGQNEWTDAFLTGLYSPDGWDTYGGIWRTYLKDHDPRGILNLIALEPENTRAANLATTCTDAPWPELDRLVQDTEATYRKARFVTWANTWESAPCAYWPAKAEQPVEIDGSRVSGALLVDQTHDGPTPYQGSLRLRKLFPKASLVAVPGGTAHAESLTGPRCVSRHVATYLADGTLPKRVSGNRADASCPAPPLPKPGR